MSRLSLPFLLAKPFISVSYSSSYPFHTRSSSTTNLSSRPQKAMPPDPRRFGGLEPLRKCSWSTSLENPCAGFRPMNLKVLPHPPRSKRQYCNTRSPHTSRSRFEDSLVIYYNSTTDSVTIIHHKNRAHQQTISVFQLGNLSHTRWQTQMKNH